jgi:hypothetical protein
MHADHRRTTERRIGPTKAFRLLRYGAETQPKRYAREEEYAESLHTFMLNLTIRVCFPEQYVEQKRLSVKTKRQREINMSILKYLNVRVHMNTG